MLPLAEVFCLKVFSPHLVWFPLDYTEQLGQQKSQIIYDVGVPNELAGPISGTRSHTALRGWGGGCLVGCQDIPSLLMASCVSNTHTTTTITTHTQTITLITETLIHQSLFIKRKWCQCASRGCATNPD